MASDRSDSHSVKINLRVIPRAKRDAIEGFSANVLRVRVTAAPQDGKANQAVVKLLARHLRLSRSSVVITSGAKSRDKVVEIFGLDEASIRERVSGSGKDQLK